MKYMDEKNPTHSHSELSSYTIFLINIIKKTSSIKITKTGNTEDLILSAIEFFLSIRTYMCVDTVAATDIGIDKRNIVITKKIIPSINPAI